MTDGIQNPALPFGEKVSEGGNGEKTPVFDEVSIIARQLILGAYDRLLPKDDTLLTRAGGTAMGLKLYDELERDPNVWEAIQKRKMALTSRNWKVTPPEADTSRAAKKAADLVGAQFKALGFDHASTTMLDAIIRGISTNEVMWVKDGSNIVCNEILDIEPWCFEFRFKPDPDEYLFARCGVRLLTPNNYGEGEKVPHRKFLIHRFGGKYNNPWGLGLGTRLFWPVFFKRQGIQFWLAFAERFGTPVPVGKYPNNAQASEKATLRTALRAFAQEAAIMVPQSMEIELLEAARSGIDTYERLCAYMDNQITGIILGTPSGAGKSGGQLASAINTANEVRLELVKADADLLSDTLNRQIVKWIIDYNMPGAPYPSVARVVEEPKDLATLAATKKILFDMGYKPTLESVKQDFGGDYIEIAPPAETDDPDTSQAVHPGAASFSDPETPGDQAAVDVLLSSVGQEQLQSLMQKILAPVIAAVRASSDHQAALEKLVELFPDLPMDDLQEALARALFALDTWGRLNVETDQA